MSDRRLPTGNTQSKASFTNFVDDCCGRDGQLHRYGTARRLSARYQARHDRGMPTGSSLHCGKTCRLVVVVNQIENKLMLSAILHSSCQHVDDDEILLAGMRADPRFEEGMKDVPGHYWMAVDLYGLEAK